MAIRRINILGKVSGKIGNTVTRIRYGKEVVYSKPESVNISYSPKAIAGRTKFSFTVKLACLVNSVPELSYIWKNSKIAGTSAYQKIIKHNSKLTSAHGLTIRNIITPPGIDAMRNSITLTFRNIVIRAAFNCQVANRFTSIFIFFLLNSGKEKELLLIGSKNIQPVYDNVVEGIINLNESDREKILSYKKAVILSCFTSKKDNSCPTNWSTTIPFEIDVDSIRGSQNIDNIRPFL